MNRRKFFKSMKILGLFGLAGVCGLGAHARPRISKAPSGDDLIRIAKSPHYKNGHFECIEPIEILNKKRNVFKAWWKYFSADKSVSVPDFAMPTIKENYQNMRDFSVAWLGHSSYFAKFGGAKILIDPVFSPYASPIFFANRAFKGTSIFEAKDFGDIDILVITHDHYDHLDYNTIKAIKDKFKVVVCGLGVGSYLRDWGVSRDKIMEFDWWESAEILGLKITFVPAQHFSGRLFKRNLTLWGGFVFENKGKSLYTSGDTGYGKIFEQIGQKFGGFDLATIECGQYNAAWPGVHSKPELSDKIARDIGAKRVIAGHSGKFRLSSHAWNDPYLQMQKFSSDKKYELLTPRIGEICEIYGENKTQKWWENLA